ncbi:MAG TPA: hypothetical protein VLJ59_18155 [Mycobacteriales bacterium]|nr:hypothetical protein [Mycobacteriales bacterium]
MLQPVGPLPPSVYWRRRLAVAGGLFVILLIGLAMCSGSSGDPRQTGAVDSPDLSVPVPTRTPSAAITASPGTAGGPAPGPALTPSGPARTGPARTGPAGAGPAGSGPVQNAPTAAPRPCPDSAILLAVSVAKPSYRIGDTPALKLTIRNRSDVACTRDVGARQQQILVYDGRTRLWSSNDCYPEGATDVRTLAAGQVVSSTVMWSGLSSQPGCTGARARVKAGTYQIIGQLGGLTSPAAKLVLTA